MYIFNNVSVIHSLTSKELTCEALSSKVTNLETSSAQLSQTSGKLIWQWQAQFILINTQNKLRLADISSEKLSSQI